MLTRDPHQLTIGNLIDFVHDTASNRSGDKPNTIELKNNDLWLNIGSAFPLFNGIFKFGLDESHLKEELQEAKKYFKDLEFSYWIMKQPDNDVLNILSQEGFVSAGEYTGLIHNITDDRYKCEYPEGVKVRVVDSQSDYHIFSNLLTKTFKSPLSIHQEFAEMFNPFTFQSPLTHYIGYYNHEPVSAITSYINGSQVGLYNGATLPEFRNKGIFTTLFSVALNDAKERNCKTAVGQLMGKKMAGGVTTKFGFKEVCYFTPFIFGKTVEP
ncbi:MAG: GNAT family N-acetyltransferase [Hyphomicrobiales bacterium]